MRVIVTVNHIAKGTLPAHAVLHREIMTLVRARYLGWDKNGARGPFHLYLFSSHARNIRRGGAGIPRKYLKCEPAMHSL